MLRICLASSRVREDLADIVNMAIEELIRQRYELPGFSTLFRAARAARVTVNRGYYRQIYQATDPVTRTHIDTLFEKGLAERRSSWDRVKSEPGQPTVKRIRAFLVHLDWLRKQAASTNSLTGIPAVKASAVCCRSTGSQCGSDEGTHGRKTVRSCCSVTLPPTGTGL